MASYRYRPDRPGKPHQVRWYTPDGPRSESFEDKSVALTFLGKIEENTSVGGFVDPQRGKITLADWFELWWLTTVNLSGGTRDQNLSYWRSMIKPKLGRTPLNKLTRIQVQAWANELSVTGGKDGTGRAPATVAKALQILRKILDAAVADNRLAANPCDRVTTAKDDDDEARFLSPDELVALEDAFPAHWADFVPFEADVGLRIGEAAAVRYRDIDFVHLKVTVREARKKVTKAHSGEATGMILGAVKTRAGRRVVPMLTRETADRLQARQVRTGAGPDDFVFTGPDGGPMTPDNFRTKVWRPAVARAGLADPVLTAIVKRQKKAGPEWVATVAHAPSGDQEAARFSSRPPAAAWLERTTAEWRGRWPAPDQIAPTPHALRHTAIAHWIAAGVIDKFELKTYAGHSSIETIDRLYGHLLPRDTSVARDAMSAMRATARAAADARPDTAEVITLSDRRKR